MTDLRYASILLLLSGGCVVRFTPEQSDADGDTTSGPSDADVGTSEGADASGGALEGSSGAGEGSSGAEPPPPSEWMVPEECTAVAAESGYCLTIDYESPALIGLDTGSVCTFGAQPPGPLFNPSFAWQGMTIVTCDHEGVMRLDLLTGESELIEHECTAVTGLDDRLLVADGFIRSALAIYDDWDAIAADAPAEELGFALQGTRMWTDGELLLDAWHSTDTLWRHTLAGTSLDDLPLEGHDGWIDGMAVLDGTLFVLTRGDSGEVELRRFDPDTGASLGTTVIEDLLVPNGLQCLPGEGG